MSTFARKGINKSRLFVSLLSRRNVTNSESFKERISLDNVFFNVKCNVEFLGWTSRNFWMSVKYSDASVPGSINNFQAYTTIIVR